MLGTARWTIATAGPRTSRRPKHASPHKRKLPRRQTQATAPGRQAPRKPDTKLTDVDRVGAYDFRVQQLGPKESVAASKCRQLKRALLLSVRPRFIAGRRPRTNHRQRNS